MRIYNKPVFYIGFIIGMAGDFSSYLHINTWPMKVIPMIVGTILMLLAFRKPKNWEEENKD